MAHMCARPKKEGCGVCNIMTSMHALWDREGILGCMDLWVHGFVGAWVCGCSARMQDLGKVGLEVDTGV